jgi:aminoglycoside 6'-N-acetyltransferase
VNGPPLRGPRVALRPPKDDDVGPLAAIRATPGVFAWWRGGQDLVQAVHDDLAEDAVQYVIELDDAVIGWVQWAEEDEPDYRYAWIDLYLDPRVHGRGLGAEAVRTVARHLFDQEGHHRIEIDPATENEAAIRCYEAVGFKTIGVRRQAERGNDGTWHDALLMDLLPEELIGPVA